MLRWTLALKGMSATRILPRMGTAEHGKRQSPSALLLFELMPKESASSLRTVASKDMIFIGGWQSIGPRKN